MKTLMWIFSLFTCSALLADNEAIYYPADSSVSIPAVVVDGDNSGALYAVDMSHDAQFRFTVTRLDTVETLDLDVYLPGRKLTFDVYDESSGGTEPVASVVWSYRNETIDGVQTLVRTQLMSDADGVLLGHQDKYYEKRADGLYLTQVRNFDLSASEGTVRDTRVKVPPKKVLSINPTPGTRWINRDETMIYSGSDGPLTARSFNIETRAMLGLRSKSVPAGSFERCVSVYTDSDSKQIDTFCPGVGPVESFNNNTKVELVALD